MSETKEPMQSDVQVESLVKKAKNYTTSSIYISIKRCALYMMACT